VNKQKENFDGSYQSEIIVLLNIYGHFIQEKGKKTYFSKPYQKQLANSNFNFIRLKKKWNGGRIIAFTER
jgi:hypothetical protein